MVSTTLNKLLFIAISMLFSCTVFAQVELWHPNESHQENRKRLFSLEVERGTTAGVGTIYAFGNGENTGEGITIPFNAHLKALTIASKSNSTATITFEINNTATSAVLTMTGSKTVNLNTLNLPISEGDKVRMRVSSGSVVNDSVIGIFIEFDDI